MIKSILDQHLQKNQNLINSSLDQRIVCTIGQTGSGKSTLLNYLCGKELIVQTEGGYKQISLLNPNDHNAFKIGVGINSSTLLPQYITHNGILFYDFAGLEDTRGFEYSLLNACFIKKLVQQARSVLILFVVEQNTIQSERGQKFLELIAKIQKLLPQIQNREVQNALIITKAKQQTQQAFKSYLENKTTALFNLNQTIDLKIFKMSLPNNQNNLCLEDRQDILNYIQQNKGKKYENINIEAIYTLREQEQINKIYEEEMKLIYQNCIPIEMSFSNLNNQELEAKRQIVKCLLEKFIGIVSDNHLISLIKIVSNNSFNQYFIKFKQLVQEKQETYLQRIENLIEQNDHSNQIINITQQNQDLQIKALRLQLLCKKRRRGRCSIF
ncbi:hypothetical protein ABPG74_013082 [Tetrahymena malaccensis]